MFVDLNFKITSFFTFFSHSQEEELSSSSSEEEDSDQRPNEDMFGKVVCVEGVATGDKKKTTWYPALVSSRPPSFTPFTVNQQCPLLRVVWFTLSI